MQESRITLTPRTRKVATGIGILAWGAVLTSLALSVTSATDVSDAFWAVFVFTGFFTIWTNTAVALAVTLPLLAPKSRLGRFFRRPGVVTGLAASIALVAIVYELLLRDGWSPLGIDLLLNLLVHYLIPVAFVVYWWHVTPKTALNWRGPLVWLSYPAAYTIFALVRGGLSGHYPYPFLDPAAFGYDGVALSIAGIGLFFLLLSVILVGAGRLASTD